MNGHSTPPTRDVVTSPPAETSEHSPCKESAKLSSAKRELLQKYRPLIHQLDREVVADLNPAEQEILIDLLGRIQARRL